MEPEADKAGMTTTLDDDLSRLSRLEGGDAGFFVLAVHSFIEAYLRRRFTPDCEEDNRYAWFLDSFRREIAGRAERFIPELEAIGKLRIQRQITNGVRHEFAVLHPEEARSAVELLCSFARLAGFEASPAVERLEECLCQWDEKRSPYELCRELAALGFRLHEESRRSAMMTRRLAEYGAATEAAQRLAAEKKGLESRLAGLEAAAARKDERVDSLRREKFDLESERKELAARVAALIGEQNANRDALADLAQVKTYIGELARMTVYTRTRFDYERRISRLSEEQKRTVDQIRLDADFLVKGAAGTGKTLVLLKALERSLGSDTLGLERRTTSILVTYTKSLVKYDGYLARIMSKDARPDRIMTIDALFFERLGMVDPGARLSFDYPRELAKTFAPPGIRSEDLAHEAEDFVWANMVSRAEYLDELIDRTGMKTALRREDRGRYMDAIEAMEARMEAEKLYSRNYSRIVFLRKAAKHPEKIGLIDYTFIDEAQDLAACDLAAVKRCTRLCVVLAGDSDQSLYRSGFGFRRAGVDISGRTRILKTNYRNTAQIHELAERYRALIPGQDAENAPEAFRVGPPPELIETKTEDELLELLCARIGLFTGHLGYEAGNIAVFAPREAELRRLEQAFADRGIPAKNIKAEDFDFADLGRVRLSTLHSAKGLDFPVVLLYLPRMLPPDQAWDTALAERLHRNLIYVAMTRALDQLSVFCLEGATSRSIVALKRCFGEMEENFARISGLDTRAAAATGLSSFGET
jgi:hypothetical protein